MFIRATDYSRSYSYLVLWKKKYFFIFCLVSFLTCYCCVHIAVLCFAHISRCSLCSSHSMQRKSRSVRTRLRGRSWWGPSSIMALLSKWVANRPFSRNLNQHIVALLCCWCVPFAVVVCHFFIYIPRNVTPPESSPLRVWPQHRRLLNHPGPLPFLPLSDYVFSLRSSTVSSRVLCVLSLYQTRPFISPHIPLTLFSSDVLSHTMFLLSHSLLSCHTLHKLNLMSS